MKVVGYGRVSKADRNGNGVSLEVQQLACRRYADAHEWEMTWLEDEGVSGGVAPEDRKGFRAALALLEAGAAEALIVKRVDRASRKTEDFAALLGLAAKQGWSVIVTEQGIDTSTPMGKAMVNIAAVFAELERDFIRQRTREALAVKRENGVTLGRPRSLPDDVLQRIERESTEGKTPYAIARDLTRDGVPTAHGASKWSPTTVTKLLNREAVRS